MGSYLSPGVSAADSGYDRQHRHPLPPRALPPPHSPTPPPAPSRRVPASRPARASPATGSAADPRSSSSRHPFQPKPLPDPRGGRPTGMIGVPAVFTNRVEHDDVEGEPEIVEALPALGSRHPVVLTDRRDRAAPGIERVLLRPRAQTLGHHDREARRLR